MTEALSSSLRESYRGCSVLVTGGLGFIGSALVRHLIDLAAKVTVVDVLTPGGGGNRFNLSGCEGELAVHELDIGRAETGTLLRGQDIVFNLAGQVSHIDSMRDPLADLDANCRAHLALLEACRQVNPTVKVVYASTRQIYGVPLQMPMDESHPVDPPDINGIHKAACERYHLMYHKVHGLRTSCLRLTNTYGPRMLVKHARQTALGWFLHQAIDGVEIGIWGDGEQRRDYTYVDDVVDAFLRAGLAAAADGLCINIGGLRPVSHLELMRSLVESAGSGSWRLMPFPPEYKRIDIGDACSSHDLAQRILGWRPSTDLEEGLDLTVRYLRENRRHYWT